MTPRPSAASFALLALCASAAMAAFDDAAQRPAARAPELAAASAADGSGWITLFDGKSLAGWRGYKQADAAGTRWSVHDGTLTLPPRDGKDTPGARDLVTTDTFDHFELRWEWKVSPGGNSGVKYFVLEDMNSAIGHEYQIIDDERHADAKIGPHRQTAAFYDVLAPTGDRRPKAGGEWNESSVRVEPSREAAGWARVYHDLNGARVLEYELDSPELRSAIAKSKFKDVGRFGKLQKGHILLQDHGETDRYRNIRIRRLTGS